MDGGRCTLPPSCNLRSPGSHAPILSEGQGRRGWCSPSERFRAVTTHAGALSFWTTWLPVLDLAGWAVKIGEGVDPPSAPRQVGE